MSILFRDILWYHDTEPTELGLGGMSTLFGLWLLNPMLSTYAAAPSFRLLAAIAPEWFWGLWFLALGVTRLWSLKHGTLIARRNTGFVTALFWFVLWAGFTMANPAATATVVYAVIDAAAIWVWVRLSIQARDAHGSH
jgi:hypothetical protein